MGLLINMELSRVDDWVATIGVMQATALEEDTRGPSAHASPQSRKLSSLPPGRWSMLVLRAFVDTNIDIRDERPGKATVTFLQGEKCLSR
jgi:hypothetical protein